MAGLVIAAVVAVALLASTVTFAVLWSGADERAATAQRNADTATLKLNDLEQAAADEARAEKVAADYAAAASTFDYRDLGPWRTALTKGVSPELKTKLEATVGAMNQMMQPLQWVSKGTVLDSVVSNRSGDVFKANVYVKVDATNVQATAGREVITVYTVTLDKSKDWQITDVGGVGGATGK
ncbi:Mce-associated membrane protein [Tsukamurella hominis]